jgi:hypothetical protein
VAPGAEFLFDRRVDPGENANLVTRERVEAERLSAPLDAHLAERNEGVVEKGVRIDPSIAERLHAMGYLRQQGERKADSPPIHPAGDGTVAEELYH